MRTARRTSTWIQTMFLAGVLLVGMVCTNPYDSCFCTSLGVSPGESTDVDLMLTDIGDQFLIEEITETGKELAGKTSGLQKATEADEAQFEPVQKCLA